MKVLTSLIVGKPRTALACVVDGMANYGTARELMFEMAGRSLREEHGRKAQTQRLKPVARRCSLQVLWRIGAPISYIGSILSFYPLLGQSRCAASYGREYGQQQYCGAMEESDSAVDKIFL